jgi:hypothetical protein
MVKRRRFAASFNTSMVMVFIVLSRSEYKVTTYEW